MALAMTVLWALCLEVAVEVTGIVWFMFGLHLYMAGLLLALGTFGDAEIC